MSFHLMIYRKFQCIEVETKPEIVNNKSIAPPNDHFKTMLDRHCRRGKDL